MAKSRLVGGYPVIGIRPTIDGRRGALKVRESLEDQTMGMARAAKKLFEENLRYSNGEPVQVVIADTTIGRVAEAAACADKFRKAGVDVTLITDSMAASVMKKGWVDAVLVGCDRVAANGDAANKIGTMPLAIARRSSLSPTRITGAAPLSFARQA